jgi:hypothetical protein
MHSQAMRFEISRIADYPKKVLLESTPKPGSNATREVPGAQPLDRALTTARQPQNRRVVTHEAI